MDSIDCKICLENYRSDEDDLTPRILSSCGHTVCEKCARRTMKNGFISCPFDKLPTKVVCDNVKTLRKNFAILDIIDRMSHPKQPAVPEKCGKGLIKCAQDSEHDATVYCEQCDAELCESCFDNIHSLNLFSGHVKFSLTDKPMKLPRCTKHPHNPAEFLCTESGCKSDIKLICHTCLLGSEHKGHTYEELMEKWLQNKEYLEKLLQKIDSIIKAREKDADELQRSASTFETSQSLFKEMCEEIVDYFDNEKRKCMQTLQDFAENSKKVREERRKKSESAIMKIESLKSEIEVMLKMKNGCLNLEEIKKKEDSICNTKSIPLNDLTLVLSDFEIVIRGEPEISVERKI